LQRTLDLKNADKGFYLKHGRGKKKGVTWVRDVTAAMYMVRTENTRLKYKERVQQAVKIINKEFPKAPATTKTVEAAYTKHGEEIKKSLAETSKLIPLI
jgi:hypothetical protein